MIYLNLNLFKLKKNIIINIHYLEIGGAETSLIGLLHSIKPEDFKVDLLINDPRGELMKYIPKWVNVLKAPEDYSMIERPMKETVKKGYLKIATARLWAKYKYGKYVRKNHPKNGDAIFGYVGKYVTKVLPPLKNLGEYDVAISYVTPHNIVAEKINAKKKIAWIHTDYSQINVNPELELPVWNSFDRIVSISSDVTKTFLKKFPSLKEKIIEVENFIPKSLIKKRADEFEANEMKIRHTEIYILTIGRYSWQKRLEDIPRIAKILKDSKVKFRWFIIGYGSQDMFNRIKLNIDNFGVKDEVILLGKKENPYPYIKSCDIYVQPSRYEGKSITVREAQLLGKPVVITDYPTAKSQIKDGVDGFIGPYETVQFAEYLKNFISNFDTLNFNTENLLEKDIVKKDICTGKSFQNMFELP